MENCAFCERGCGLRIASTQSRGIPRESGLSGSATRFSLYSAHFGARRSQRRCHSQIRSLATGDVRSRSTSDLRATGVWQSRTAATTFFARPLHSEGENREGSVLRVTGRRESRNECRGRHQLLAQRGGGLLRAVILRWVFHGKTWDVTVYLSRFATWNLHFHYRFIIERNVTLEFFVFTFDAFIIIKEVKLKITELFFKNRIYGVKMWN